MWTLKYWSDDNFLHMPEWKMTYEAVQMVVKNLLGEPGKPQIDELRAYALM